MEQLYTLNEVSEYLKVSIRTVRRLLEEKNLPVIHVGRQVRIEESVINNLVQRVEPVSLEKYNINL